LSLRPHFNSGRLRGLAVSSTKRSPAAPELPTVAEAGVPGYEVDQWYGIITSAKVPRPLVQKLHAGIGEALKAPDVVKRFSAEGSTPVGTTPEQFSAHIKAEIGKWSRLVKDARIQLN
jgi:tripartite-type tricarboxylate transporter receptor subunit TctC